MQAANEQNIPRMLGRNEKSYESPALGYNEMLQLFANLDSDCGHKTYRGGADKAFASPCPTW